MWDAKAKKGEKGITIPGGRYTPKSDDLFKEVIAAAKSAGLENFNVKIGGRYYDDPDDLPTNSIAELGDKAIVVEPYDIAG